MNKKLSYHDDTKLFALERNYELKSIIDSIYQTFNKKDVYQSLEEKDRIID